MEEVLRPSITGGHAPWSRIGVRHAWHHCHEVRDAKVVHRLIWLAGKLEIRGYSDLLNGNRQILRFVENVVVTTASC